MSKIISVLSSPRFVSFYWRGGMMVAAFFLSFVAENLSLFELSPQTTTILGLVLGEITKALNNWTQNKPLGFANPEL